MLSPSDYTVGWICAIAPEYNAATLCLDEEHDSLKYREPGDTNAYTLGKIGNHNVVIACSPNGSYGPSSASGVATHLLRSFPNIRIGLTVGTGGGAPAFDRDIRLGDIVVSSPGNGRGGVLPYTAGKRIQEQDFKITGFVNQPPTTLLSAVMKLRNKYKRRQIKLEESIDRILKKEHEELQEELERPDDSTDILYKSDFVHPKIDQRGCTETCNLDSEAWVPRPKRTNRPFSPVIHYGLIASGEQIMKDALYRDELAEQHGVLCFETEAAGLMNNFPCLVVRGVCNYSDSHKSNAWQAYAALSASAYAKDLLQQIPPEISDKRQKMMDVVSDVQQSVKTLVQSPSHHSQEQQDIIHWISEIDYAAKRGDHFAKRESRTAECFLNSKEYRNWLETENQVLSCREIPGAEKPIFSAIVVADLYTRFRNDAAVGIGYLYCDFRQHQTIDRKLLSLVKQLCQKHMLIPGVVKEAYLRHKKQSTRPSLFEISRLLHCVCNLYSKVFLVIDALDECHDADNCCSTLISTVFECRESQALNILVTSRSILGIETKFEECQPLKICDNEADSQLFLAGPTS